MTPDPMDPWRLPVPGVAAHRGGRALGPENTLIGISRGLGAGATHVELDVRATRDGEAVCFHDETAERTCLTDGEISQMSLADVLELDPCALWGEFAGIATGEREPPEGTARPWFQVPTLEQALRAFRGVPVILDVKDTAPPEALAEAVESWRDPRDVLVGGYDDDVLDEVSEHLPEAARGPGFEDTKAFYSGEEIEADVLVVPPEHEGLELVEQRWVDRAHDQGMGFWVWTINEAAEARAFFEMGVDGVITDHPGKISRERVRTFDAARR